MTKSNYNCSQQELYTVCRLGWQSCKQHLNDFSNFKGRYDDDFISERLNEVEKAAALKDDQARGDESETLRIKLTQSATNGLANWQKLKRYIADAYTAEFQKTKTEAAGINYYEKASNANWDSVQGLLYSGAIFINENLADLTANKNMPDTFNNVFNTAKAQFDELHKNFLDSEETMSINTELKVSQNNDIYAKLISMFLDGQEIFRNQEAVQKQFIFDQALNLVSGIGTAGIKGYLTNSKTKSPIIGATIKIDQTNKSGISDESGRYEITQVASGKYPVVISAEGYQTTTIAEQEIKVGTVSTLSVELSPM